MSAEQIDQLRNEVRRVTLAVAEARKCYLELSRISGSPMAAAQAEDFRCQWERLLEEKAALLEPTLTCLITAEEANRKLSDRTAQLELDNKRLVQQFRKLIGVTPKSMQTSKKKDAEKKKNTGAAGDDAPKENAAGTDQTEGAAKTAKKRGAPAGHKGASRPIPPPELIAETRLIPPPTTCSCGCCKGTRPIDEFDDLYIEDIPPVMRFITRLRYQRGLCNGCGEKLRHEAAVAGPPVILGPNLSILLGVMRQAGLTYRKLGGLCSDIFEIPLSAAGALGVVSRTAEMLRPYYDEIKGMLKDQDVLNIDETGWKINFRSAYIWCLCNPRLAWFHPDTSRAGKVVEEILGKDYSGTVVCDFYGGYNFFKHLQRCMVHFLRDLHAERQLLPGSLGLERFETAVKTLIEHGIEVSELMPGSQIDERFEALKKELQAIIRMKVPRGRAETLQTRLKRHQDEILTFAQVPGVEYHNNRSERQIRPLVVNRKNSFGSATKTGAEHTCILNSIVETCRLNSKKPVEFIRQVVNSVATGLLPSLFPPQPSLG